MFMLYLVISDPSPELSVICNMQNVGLSSACPRNCLNFQHNGFILNTLITNIVRNVLFSSESSFPIV